MALRRIISILGTLLAIAGVFIATAPIVEFLSPLGAGNPLFLIAIGIIVIVVGGFVSSKS
jgi:hypothetical protein